MILQVMLQKDILSKEEGMDFLRDLKKAEQNHNLINVRVQMLDVEQINLADIPDE